MCLCVRSCVCVILAMAHHSKGPLLLLLLKAIGYFVAFILPLALTAMPTIHQFFSRKFWRINKKKVFGAFIDEEVVVNKK